MKHLFFLMSPLSTLDLLKTLQDRADGWMGLKEKAEALAKCDIKRMLMMIRNVSKEEEAASLSLRKVERKEDGTKTEGGAASRVTTSRVRDGGSMSKMEFEFTSKD